MSKRRRKIRWDGFSTKSNNITLQNLCINLIIKTTFHAQYLSLYYPIYIKDILLDYPKYLTDILLDENKFYCIECYNNLPKCLIYKEKWSLVPEAKMIDYDRVCINCVINEQLPKNALAF